jgi:GNAT superfamily N-acetyltransferase
LGCGILTRVNEGRKAVDIGFLVSTNHRRNGIGSLIANHITSTCLERGDIPIAGCSSENIGSKKTLESAGFITQYQLLELSL